METVKASVAYVVSPAGQPRLELLQYHSPIGDGFQANSIPNTLGLRHLALSVDNIDSAVQRLREAGTELLSRPVVVPTDVIQHSTGQKILCYFHDPDGILLELTEYRHNSLDSLERFS